MNVREALAHIAHAVGTVSSEITPTSLVNDAGQSLVGMHPWQWCVRPPVTLDLVGGQSWVTLPSDFRSWLAIRFVDSRARHFARTTIGQVEELRTSGQAVGTTTWGALVHAPDAKGVPMPRLEIWPTPTTSEPAGLRLLYTGTWVKVDEDLDRIPLPDWFPESLFKAVLRAHAEGYEKGDIGDVNARVAAIKAGPLFRMAEEQDRVMSPDYGAVMATDETWAAPWWDRPLLDPV